MSFLESIVSRVVIASNSNISALRDGHQIFKQSDGVAHFARHLNGLDSGGKCHDYFVLQFPMEVTIPLSRYILGRVRTIWVFHVSSTMSLKSILNERKMTWVGSKEKLWPPNWIYYTRGRKFLRKAILLPFYFACYQPISTCDSSQEDYSSQKSNPDHEMKEKRKDREPHSCWFYW